MQRKTLSERIVVSEKGFRSEDPYDIIASNISFVDALLDKNFPENEAFPDSLRSYYLDYYHGQMNNGGFSQFIYNTRGHPGFLEWARTGLQAVGAKQHLAFLEQSASVLDQLESARLESFLSGDYFGENPVREILSQGDDRFFAISRGGEDLFALHAAWLKTHPHLMVLSIAGMEAEIERLCALVGRRS